VLALATTHGHNRGYGAAAARIQVNGKIAFMGGRVGSYDSSKEGYMADPRNLGQVTHDGRRVPTAVPDGSRLELHGSMRRAKTQSLELVFVIDVDFEGLSDHVIGDLCAALGGAHMTMKTVLEDKTSGHKLPPIMMFPMPSRPDNYDAQMRTGLLSTAASQCMAIRCPRQAVAKGRESATTTRNAQIEFLIHQLNTGKCPYPGEVYEHVLALLETHGISRDRVSARYHLNIHEDDWTAPKFDLDTVQSSIDPEIMQQDAPPDSQQVALTAQSLAAADFKELNHRFHYDPSKKKTDAGEMKTRRCVFTMEIECTTEELHGLKTRMSQQKEEIPQKTGDPTFQFEVIVGKTHYRLETYISNGPQATIAAGLHKAFANVCSDVGL
jgi:hypothetical protein